MSRESDIVEALDAYIEARFGIETRWFPAYTHEAARLDEARSDLLKALAASPRSPPREDPQMTETDLGGFAATALVLSIVALLVVAFLRSQRSTHTPTVQPRVSKDDLAVCAKVARSYFDRNIAS